MLLLLTLAAAPAVPATTRAGVVDRSTPQAAMQTLVEAIEREDEAAIASAINSTNEAEHKLARAYARSFIASRRYWHAAWKRWGRQESIRAYVQRDLRLPDFYLDYPRAEWDIQGDRAVVKHQPGTKGFVALSPLQKIGGQWLYDPTRRMTPKELQFALARAEENVAKYTKLAADIDAGKFASIHEAIDVLFPRQRRADRPAPDLKKEDLDPETIEGAMLLLGLAAQEEDPVAMARFYHADGPGGAQLVGAHVRGTLAVHRFILAMHRMDRDEPPSRLANEFALTDPRNDTFGHLITEWTIIGDRATGINDAGPAAASMRRIDGKWKINLTPPAGSPPVEKLAEELRRQTEIVAAVTADIRERRFFTVDEVRRELKRRGLAPATQPASEGEADTN